MEKYSIEINTEAGWVNYHSILRPGEEKAKSVLKEIQEKFPSTKFRIMKWSGEVINND